MLKEKRIFAIGAPGDVLTREALDAVYGIDTLVKIHPLTGKPYILPVYDNTTKNKPERSVHVICGGGTGSDLLYALQKEGFRMSTGVLTIFDTDYATATALHIPCVTEAPFSAISSEAREELGRCIDAADAVVVTAMPIGKGNLDNIRILKHYRTKSIILLDGDGLGSFRDYTGGEAETIIHGLLEQGAVWTDRIEQVAHLLKETA